MIRPVRIVDRSVQAVRAVVDRSVDNPATSGDNCPQPVDGAVGSLWTARGGKNCAGKPLWGLAIGH